jgi:hypothetical protein
MLVLCTLWSVHKRQKSWWSLQCGAAWPAAVLSLPRGATRRRIPHTEASLLTKAELLP